MLTMQHVSFEYGTSGYQVLSDISASFDVGELIAVTGRNGSGKTTLTRLLVGLEQPSNGMIFYKNKNISKESVAMRSRFIGYVFQQPDCQMFMPTVKEEIAFGPYQQGKRGKELEETVLNAMNAMDLLDYEESYPRNLSRGIQQRVAIASAIAMDIKYLILDEPTSGQDGNDKKKLISLMHTLRYKGITVILVTHDMDIVASACTRVIVIADKHIVYDGSPMQLFEKEGNCERWGLATPFSIALGKQLPHKPYCKNMQEFCSEYLKLKKKV